MKYPPWWEIYRTSSFDIQIFEDFFVFVGKFSVEFGYTNSKTNKSKLVGFRLKVLTIWVSFKLIFWIRHFEFLTYLSLI